MPAQKHWPMFLWHRHFRRTRVRVRGGVFGAAVDLVDAYVGAVVVLVGFVGDSRVDGDPYRRGSCRRRPWRGWRDR
jgi:hypothetical protein